MFKREMALGCLKDIQKALALIEERSAIVLMSTIFCALQRVCCAWMRCV